MLHEKRGPVTYSVQVFFEKEEGGGYHVYVPALKGLHSCGDTLREAKRNASDAIVAFLSSMMQHGDPIPLTCVHSREEHQAHARSSVVHRQELLQVNV